MPEPLGLRCYRLEESGGDRRWTPAGSPPLARLGEDVFVSAPPGAESHRAYVNGHPVLALHAVRPNDLVLVRTPDGECETLLIAPPGPETGVPAEGRRCAFTRAPIGEEGGVRCGGCARLYRIAVATQLGSCPVCGDSLDPARCGFEPPEELK